MGITVIICRKCWGQVEHEEGRRLYEDGGLSMARLLVELLKIVPEVRNCQEVKLIVYCVTQ